MALTPEQIAKRRYSVGGSDANTIMSGDMKRITQLWKEKHGDVAPEDLSDILPVQMGSFTEPLNIQWFTKQTGRIVTQTGEEHRHPLYPHITCTLDGMTDDGKTVFEAKHVSPFAKEEGLMDRYMPQLHHNMSVMGVRQAVLSVFFGNLRWERYDVIYDDFYGAVVTDSVNKFWNAVQNNISPELVFAEAPKEFVARADMNSNNMWAHYAGQYNDMGSYKAMWDEAVAGLKELVPDGAQEAYGHGVIIKRDKRGVMRVRGEKNDNI